MLDSNELDSLMKSNTVKVLTVHSAKGLENKNVIIAYRNPLYANWNYDDTGNIKKPEEIKLYYVAITRAIDNLYIL
jgi:superfamily I DNA/RNA helicase